MYQFTLRLGSPASGASSSDAVPRTTGYATSMPTDTVSTPAAARDALSRKFSHPRKKIDRVIHRTEARVRAAHATHLGYPYNLTAGANHVSDLRHYLVNNLGDPYAGSHYASEVCDLERETVAWLMNLWQCEDPDRFWGSVVTGGTEGNLWALYLAREAFPHATLLYSDQAHYSIPKAARILRMRSIAVSCDASGAIDVRAFEKALHDVEGRSVVVALTCGTTMTGAHDDIGAVLNCLDAAGIGPDRRFVHVDGALNAMVLPFVAEAPLSIRPTFHHAIDSISTSGHKMIGTPVPCGVLVARRSHVDAVASTIAYLRSDDTTLMGSRNGHAVVDLWSRLHGHGVSGYRTDVSACVDRAQRLAERLAAEGVPVLRNPHSLTVVFPQPSESIVRTYQLACEHGHAHTIVMPSVTDVLLEQFADEYVRVVDDHLAAGHPVGHAQWFDVIVNHAGSNVPAAQRTAGWARRGGPRAGLQMAARTRLTAVNASRRARARCRRSWSAG